MLHTQISKSNRHKEAKNNLKSETQKNLNKLKKTTRVEGSFVLGFFR